MEQILDKKKTIPSPPQINLLSFITFWNKTFLQVVASKGDSCNLILVNKLADFSFLRGIWGTQDLEGRN